MPIFLGLSDSSVRGFVSITTISGRCLLSPAHSSTYLPLWAQCRPQQDLAPLPVHNPAHLSRNFTHHTHAICHWTMRRVYFMLHNPNHNNGVLAKPYALFDHAYYTFSSRLWATLGTPEQLRVHHRDGALPHLPTFATPSTLIITLVQMRIAMMVGNLGLHATTTTSSRTATIPRTTCATSATTPPRPSGSMRRFWRMEHVHDGSGTTERERVDVWKVTWVRSVPRRALALFKAAPRSQHFTARRTAVSAVCPNYAYGFN
ncbi:hypothetical protein FIBSPDRAFT_896540 [Athelia psychrophila]|uniref:Uncharacterized protein n=1 Tax=Athelia psychrophila TaxID=1759441 RepID=A0A166DBQ2_9AGAM|nr:hypothetical protein FIBSPDRAFT_896540 [Fibularhizoctonia sp. CBS 109695]